MPKEIQSQLAELQNENAALKAAAEQRGVREKLIADKTAFGLSPEQADAVLRRQAEYDAARKHLQSANA
jgi:hypothetical protein